MSDPAARLAELVNGYQVSQAIHVAAVLGIADRLRDGPRSSDELAAACDAHGPSLYRLLRALAAVGVLEEQAGRVFALAPLGEPLRSDVDGSLHGWAAFVGRPYYREAWSNLLHSVRTGENAFRRAHGTDVWSYRESHAEEGVIFDAAMTSTTRRVNLTLLEAYDFGRFGTIVDVGGGRGALLAGILSRWPDTRGVLFDQPHVADAAADTFAAAGVSARVEIVGGSFFDGVPPGGDAYLLKAIVHDWEDGESAAILAACREQLPDGGAVLVVERVVDDGAGRVAAAFSDLNMLVAPGGRERTAEEFEVLFASAGLRLAGITPSASGWNVVEAVQA